MGTVLHLGVIEVPYAHEKESTTTGDVAEFLEAKYHPMEIFSELHADAIQNLIETGYVTALESMISGAPMQDLEDVLNKGTTEVDKLFKDFIDRGEMEHLGYPGIPTQASIDRKSSRFKSGKSK